MASFSNLLNLSDLSEPKLWILDEILDILNFCKKNLNNNNILEFDTETFSKDIFSKIPKISEEQLYFYIADYFANLIKQHYIFEYIASWFAVYRLHKMTNSNYLTIATDLYANNLINNELYNIVLSNNIQIQNKLDYSRDYLFDFFAIRTLERSYLLKKYNLNNIIILERPQHLFMRVALAIWGNNLERAFETYDYLSKKYMTHATPTLFNSGTNKQQLSSCFLLGMGDSIEKIFSSITNIAYISKWAGGIGIHLSSIRAKNSIIRGTNGKSDGIVPLCVLINKEGRYINQGGKRNGSIAVYLEPWHADIFDFIELRQPNGDENLRAHDLFLALWVNDLFMKRVLEDGDWSLMCPDACPDLVNTFGNEFEVLYTKYESENKFKKQIKALDLWNKIIECQIQSGMPYLLFKDHANNKSNQKNLGTIRSSNLCVSGDTKILTHSGHVKIRDLNNINTKIWNGREWSQVLVQKTGTNQKLIEITFSHTFEKNPAKIKCTPYHKFYINNNQEIAANNLKIGDIITNYEYPENDAKYSPVLICNNITVININTNNIEPEDTYCFNEPIRHRGLFNGILTGQCAEIIEYSDDDAISVCNLASICLPQFIKHNNNNINFDFEKLIEIARTCTRNLNRIIDINYYPVSEAKNSNFKNRPIGIGIQGLADVYNIFGYAFDSPEAKLLNKKIFETIYYGALYESCELAKIHGPYETFTGSPASEGILQYHMWGLTESDLLMNYDWLNLIKDIKNHGIRNSLLTALMPTASTAQIMGNCESFEPYHSNIFIRETLAGEFIVVNKNLIKDLIKENIWSEDIRKKIIIDNGSIQNIQEIPQKYKNIYKTAFEIKMRDIIDQSADRGAFIDQSQSMNLFMAHSDRNKLHSAHIHSWKRGLKTAMYYLRSRPSMDPINFGIDIDEINKLQLQLQLDLNSDSNNNNNNNKSQVCKWRPGMNIKECEVCSS